MRVEKRLRPFGKKERVSRGRNGDEKIRLTILGDAVVADPFRRRAAWASGRKV